MFLFSRTSKRKNFHQVQRKINRKKIITLLLGIGCLIAMGLLLWRFPVLAVSEVNIKQVNADCISEQEVVNRLNIKGQNILFLDVNKSIETLKKENLCIYQIRINKSLPSKVEVEVIGREAILKVFKVNESTVSASLKQLEATSSTISSVIDFSIENRVGDDLLIDNEGLLFKKADESDQLDQVGVVMESLEIGKSLPQVAVLGVEKIIEKLKQLEIDLKSYKISKNNRFLLVDGQIKLVFLIDETEQRGNFPRLIERQLASLQLILQKDKMESNDVSTNSRKRVIERIDLSYDKPIIVYSTKRI